MGMSTLRKALYLVLFVALPLAAQLTDCAFTRTFTGDLNAASSSNLSGNTPCVNWRVTYSTTGTLASTVTFQTSPDNSSWTSVPNTICSATVQPPCILQGTNPLTGTTQGMSLFAAYGSYVRVITTASSGTGTGTIRGYGAKGATAEVGIGPGSVTVTNETAANLQVTTRFADTSQLDAFSRLRVSQPVTLFDSQFQYGLQPFFWESVVTAGGTAAAVANASSVLMTVSSSGDQAVRQSHRYFRYQPGKSQLAAMTGIMGAIKANTRQRIGYFDAQNGLFFEQDGTALRVVQRTFTSGAAVDTAINQASWNLDPLNGTGPSGLTLNMADAQIFLIDLQWLGVGRVRFGFDIGGQIVYCHQVLNANTIASVYMTTANLPLRYELAMTGATTATTMTQICQAVISEGGFENERGLFFTANNGATSISVTTRRPILSIRPKATFNSITNRGLIEPQAVEAEIGSGDALIELVYNGTLTSASFASVDANSLTEKDVAASAITGGTTLLSFYVSGGGATARNSVNNPLGPLIGKLVTLTLDAAGSVPDVLSVVVTSFTGAVTASGIINWKEVY